MAEAKVTAAEIEQENPSLFEARKLAQDYKEKYEDLYNSIYGITEDGFHCFSAADVNKMNTEEIKLNYKDIIKSMKRWV